MSERAMQVARACLAPYFATDGEDDNAEMVEALLGSFSAALDAFRPIAADDPAEVERVRERLCPYRRDAPGVCLDNHSRYAHCQQGRQGNVACEEIARNVLALFTPERP